MSRVRNLWTDYIYGLSALPSKDHDFEDDDDDLLLRVCEDTTAIFLSDDDSWIVQEIEALENM